MRDRRRSFVRQPCDYRRRLFLRLFSSSLRPSSKYIYEHRLVEYRALVKHMVFSWSERFVRLLASAIFEFVVSLTVSSQVVQRPRIILAVRSIANRKIHGGRYTSR